MTSNKARFFRKKMYASQGLRLLKIITIDALEHVGVLDGDADVVIDHELRELLAVDEDDLLFDALDVFFGVA